MTHSDVRGAEQHGGPHGAAARPGPAARRPAAARLLLPGLQGSHPVRSESLFNEYELNMNIYPSGSPFLYLLNPEETSSNTQVIANNTSTFF